ncbi:MAG: hypothetical protein E7458_05270 [Ruminococcaceae bacterium]|nr:hypothetical protein [Oscillospiraceae bacterium]
MEKNVIVVDEQGNQIGVTYPKRAKGLVKNGRARYVDDSTICLACPPNQYLEDKTMTEEIMNQNIEETTHNAVSPAVYDLAYILRQLENIAADNAYLIDALHQLKRKEDGTFAIGIGNAVEARERTNQKLIEFYQEIYRDMKQSATVGFSTAYTEKLADQLMDAIIRCTPGEETKVGCLQDMLKFVLRHVKLSDES